MKRLPNWIFTCAIAVWNTTLFVPAEAQDYPNKAIRIVTSGIGGTPDFMSRLLAGGMSPTLGQPIVIDNRSSGLIPGQVVVAAPPDGYTLLVYGGTTWVGPLFQKAPSYDPLRDLAPISMITFSSHGARSPSVIAGQIRQATDCTSESPPR